MHVAYISAYDYAGGTASSIRADGFVSALEVEGHRVSRMSHSSYIADTWERRMELVGPFMAKRLRVLCTGTAVKQWLSDLGNLPDVIVVYGTDVRFVHPVRKWAEKQHIPVILDVVDWFQASDVSSSGQRIFALLNSVHGMRRESTKVNAVVVASRFLADHYEGHGLKSHRIPALIEPVAATSNISIPALGSNRELTLAYVGDPGKKDAQTVSNLRRLSVDRSINIPRVAVHLVGIPREDISLEGIGPVTICSHGRLPRSEALDVVRTSDFTVLQRPSEQRYAQAGFPSKFAESLLHGTPVLANLSSDLDEFLIEGVTGVILADDSYESLREGLTRAEKYRKEGTFDTGVIESYARKWFTPSSQSQALSQFVQLAVGS